MGTLDRFREAFGEGQRASLFEVSGSFGRNSGNSTGEPAVGGGDINAILVKSAQFPSSTIGLIEVPYKGRRIKMPGDRIFNEWSISVMVDKEHTLHRLFIEWSNAINSHTNVESAGIATDLKQDWSILALAPDDASTATSPNQQIDLIGCWPAEVGTVEFSWENNDTIAEFTVTMQYDYWVNDVTT